MNKSPIIVKEQNPNLMYISQLANKYKTITRPSNPKITKLLSCSKHNSKTPKTCHSSQSEIGGGRGAS